MFWASVLGGFSLLVEWRILVGILLFILVDRLLLAMQVRLTKQAELLRPVARRLRERVRLAPIGILMALFVAFLHPTLLSRGGLAAPGEVAAAVPALLGSALVGSAVVVGLCLLPWIGRVLESFSSTLVFLLGLLVWRLFLGGLGGSSMPSASNISAFPGAGASLGYLAVAALLEWAVALPFFIPQVARHRVSTLMLVVVHAGQSVASFLPLLMYADNIRRLLQHG